MAEQRRENQESGYVAQAKDGALSAKSWAVGGTGTRPGEDTNNAEYWAGQAAAAAGGGVISFNGRTGTVKSKSGDYDPRMVGARTNQNLIINHRMIGTGDPGSYPINQRGQKTYTPDWLQYSIDGWNVEANQQIKIEIKNGYITVSNTDPSKELQLKQILPEGLLTAGESYTLSTYVTAVSGGVRFQIGMTDSPYTGVCIMSPKENDIVSATVDELPAVSSGSWKVIYYLPAGSAVTIADQKLETGKIQTLGWKDSAGKVHLYETLDYGGELARCQRRLLKIGANSAWGYAENPTKAYLFVPLPVSMRAKPVWTGTLPRLYPNDGNTVTSVSVLSIADNMACLMVDGAGFTGGKVYSANELEGFLSAEL